MSLHLSSPRPWLPLQTLIPSSDLPSIRRVAGSHGGDDVALPRFGSIGDVRLRRVAGRRITHAQSVRPLLVECRRYRDREREREALPYIVTVITPPPRALGVHHLPPNMQCGETVEVKGEPYIVSSVTYRYQLRRGRYEPSQKRLEVQTTGRYLVNLFLDNLLETS